MNVETLVVGPLQANCYLLYDDDTKMGAIIDPGAEEKKIIKWIEALEIKPCYILNTHGHFDHIGANDKLRQALNIPIYIAKQDAHMLGGEQRLFGMRIKTEKADYLLEDGETLDLAGNQIKVILTPGHTEGGAVFYLPDEGICFTGDTIFKGTVGRTDLEGGDFNEILMSVQNRLAHLPDSTVIYPGHGPKTNFEFERRHNPYFRYNIEG